MHIRRVQRTGTSLTVSLPSDFCKEMEIRKGDVVAVAEHDGILTVGKLDEDKIKEYLVTKSDGKDPRR